MEGSSVQFNCHFDGCSRSFKRRDKLEIHLRTHTGERPFVCLIPGCSKSYARSQHLSRHVDRVHTQGKNDSKVICPQCNLEFVSLDCLKKHNKSFHSDADEGKSYQCPEDGCSEVFRKKQQLVTHRENAHVFHLHLATRCYKCPHEGCDKIFRFPNKLKRHIKVHQGYMCDLEDCEEVFPTWSTLRKHKAVDHGPSLECNICHSTFTTMTNLRQHLRQLHNTQEEAQHVCPVDGCARTFQYKKNLTQHVRAFHEGKQVFIKKPKPPQQETKKRPRPSRKKSTAARLTGLDDRPKDFKSSLLNGLIGPTESVSLLGDSMTPVSLPAVLSPTSSHSPIDLTDSPPSSSDVELQSNLDSTSNMEPLFNIQPSLSREPPLSQELMMSLDEPPCLNQEFVLSLDVLPHMSQEPKSLDQPLTTNCSHFSSLGPTQEPHLIPDNAVSR